jgi:hypothetical protein
MSYIVSIFLSSQKKFTLNFLDLSRYLKDEKFNSEKLTLDPCVSLFELLKPFTKIKTEWAPSQAARAVERKSPHKLTAIPRDFHLHHIHSRAHW